jgi:hypothetical protein
MDGSDNVLLISEFFKEEDFLFTACDVEDLLAFGFRDQFKGTVGLFVGNEDFTVLRMSLFDRNGMLSDLFMQVGCLLEPGLQLLCRFE